MPFQQVVIQGHTYSLDTKYDLSAGKILGRGSFGVVTTALDTVSKQQIAIKRIRPYSNDEWDARHTIREIRLMKLLKDHPNVITLYDLSLFEEKAELYMMMELMDCDLHRIIQSKQALSDQHYKCFTKQLLEGIKAMHSVGVFHRDLKPGNILVAKDCQLRITDFGLARYMDDQTLAGNNRENPMTEYVVTRWYRCPELLLAPNRPYTEAVDMWSIGCILGELINRKPLFPGKSHAHQVQLVFELKGYKGPSDDFGFALSSEAVSFLDRRCKGPGSTLAAFVPHAIPPALSLLDAMLKTDPNKRPSAADCLKFPYMADAQTTCDYSKGTTLKRPDRSYFDFENQKYTLAQLCTLIRKEVAESQGVPFEEFLKNNNIANEVLPNDTHAPPAVPTLGAVGSQTSGVQLSARMEEDGGTTPATVRANHGGGPSQTALNANDAAVRAAATKADVNAAGGKAWFPGLNANGVSQQPEKKQGGGIMNMIMGKKEPSTEDINKDMNKLTTKFPALQK